jgi:hypothetical protein
MESIVRFGGSWVLLSHSIDVTPQEAVVTEAIAEEHLATEEQLRKEHAAAGPNHGWMRRSQFTSWIYASGILLHNISGNHMRILITYGRVMP